jgi:zinc transport system substrate-binding protein
MTTRTTTVAAITVLLVLCGAMLLTARKDTDTSPAPNTTSTIAVAASFYPLWYFATEIGGPNANVYDVTPAGAEPHDYEPTADAMARIESSRLLIVNGSLEAWADRARVTLDPSRTQIVVAGGGLTTNHIVENGAERVDPHVWLAPPLAKKMVAKIKAGFVSVDPAHAAEYAANAANLDARLDALDTLYRTTLAHCDSTDIVTSHAAFGYLAAAYGLTQVPIAGLSPDAEPSPAQLASIVTFARDHHVSVIFFESLASPKLADTIANEVGARTMVLDPLEGLTAAEISAGKDYFTVMQQNLANLSAALICKP